MGKKFYNLDELSSTNTSIEILSLEIERLNKKVELMKKQERRLLTVIDSLHDELRIMEECTRLVSQYFDE